MTFSMDATTELRSRREVTREPRDTESGHAWFGGGSLEKYPQGQLAGDLSYRTHGSEGTERRQRLSVTRLMLPVVLQTFCPSVFCLFLILPVLF